MINNHLLLDYDENMSYFLFERVGGFVDMLGMVRDLEDLVSREGLEPDEMRLYLLLLANCDKSGRGRTGCRRLAIIFRRRHFQDRISQALNRLAVLGLIQVESFLGQGDDVVLSYSITCMGTQNR